VSDSRTRFAAHVPTGQFLHADDLAALPDLLQTTGWLEPGETVTGTEKPGAGNMNFVRRVRTDRRSFILKQARPWVEKFPQLDAPVERIATEARFYELVSGQSALRGTLPGLVGYDPAHALLAVEDLGESADYTFLYQRGTDFAEADRRALVAFLSALHAMDGGTLDFPDNLALRRLNHEHIFYYPYLADNGLDLDTVQPGLRAVAAPYQTDEALKSRIQALGERYLGTGGTLLHGDFYPGSWLRTTGGLRVIDPEFAFVGPPEFDLGVLAAHLLLTQRPAAEIRETLGGYRQPAGFDAALWAGFCGAEVLRRLIGLAQVPVSLRLDEKTALLARAAALVQHPETGTELWA
jgi:5-methylthioribose kinase